ncbi:hypothetical protein FPQ18DRAFT_323160 [Pyronema domesticum]|nr:hypothetical protein FPQ18DRAFT_323160 [Pyronema domesticum]
MKPPLLLRWWKEKLSLHHDCWAACAVVPLPHTLPSSIHPRVPPSSTRLSPSLHLPPSTPHHTSSRRRQTPILFIRSDLWKIQTINVTNNLLAGCSLVSFLCRRCIVAPLNTHTRAATHSTVTATVLYPVRSNTNRSRVTRTNDKTERTG